MGDDDVARCAGPGCGQPLTRLATGRPARYCGPNCRKAAQRDRDRRAEAELQLAARLAHAGATASRSWHQLGEDAHAAGDLAAAVVTHAAGHDRQDLTATLAEFRETARRVEALAIEYFDAAALAARLTAALRDLHRGGRGRVDAVTEPAKGSARTRPGSPVPDPCI